MNNFCSLTWCLCSTARTDCSVVDYIMLVLRVAELVLITVITVLLIRAPGKKIHTSICLDWWTQSVSLQLKCYSVLYFPGNQRAPDDDTVSIFYCYCCYNLHLLSHFVAHKIHSFIFFFQFSFVSVNIQSYFPCFSLVLIISILLVCVSFCFFVFFALSGAIFKKFRIGIMTTAFWGGKQIQTNSTKDKKCRFLFHLRQFCKNTITLKSPFFSRHILVLNFVLYDK